MGKLCLRGGGGRLYQPSLAARIPGDDPRISVGADVDRGNLNRSLASDQSGRCSTDSPHEARSRRSLNLRRIFSDVIRESRKLIPIHNVRHSPVYGRDFGVVIAGRGSPNDTTIEVQEEIGARRWQLRNEGRLFRTRPFLDSHLGAFQIAKLRPDFAK